MIYSSSRAFYNKNQEWIIMKTDTSIFGIEKKKRERKGKEKRGKINMQKEEKSKIKSNLLLWQHFVVNVRSSWSLQCIYLPIRDQRSKREERRKKKKERETSVYTDINLWSDNLRVRNKYELTYTCPKANYKHKNLHTLCLFVITPTQL